MKKCSYVLAFLIVLSPNAFTQRIKPNGTFVLNLDYAKFRNDEKSGYLEIYYGFYPQLINYVRMGDRYVGVMKLETRLTEVATGERLINDRSNVPISISDTSDPSYRYPRVSQAGYAIPTGEYRLEVMVTDTLDPSVRDSATLPISVQAISAKAAISDIELCSSIKASEEKGSTFYKNTLDVVPNPTLLFGVISQPMMFSYVEFYNLAAGDSYKVKTQILSPDGKVVKETSKDKKYGVKNAVEAGMTNVASLASGKYRVRIMLVDTTGSVLAQSEKTFFTYNPHVQTSQSAAISAMATQLAGLSSEELAEEFRAAQYVATDQEIKTFTQITSLEGRRDFLARFWADVEGGRLGIAGFTRVGYLQRISTANQRYRSMGKDGWRTDRGRVLVLYAEPDEVERHSSSQEGKPYEVWHYNSIENGVEFIFVDRTGFSDYVLVHSTKRGELRDDTWQRFLQ
ncbi:MAG: GWxTD domain-containing protein [Bacteroidota bacterium]